MIGLDGPVPGKLGPGYNRPFKKVVFASQCDKWHICKGVKCLIRTLRGTPVVPVLQAMQQLRIETVQKQP